MTLADRIEARIREIPASNPGVISFAKPALHRVLDRDLIRRIAEEAAAVMDEER